MKSDDSAYLLDIVTAGREIQVFRGSLDSAGFANDRKTQAAVLHHLMVIGEATKRLSTEFRDAHPEHPWKQIASMRDRLVHGYDHVRLEVVWDAVCNHLPGLVTDAEQWLSELQMDAQGP